MRFYCFTANASGDRNLSYLMKSLSKIYPNAQFRGIGGRMMRLAGLQSVRATASDVIGFLIFKYLFIALQWRRVKVDMLSYQPDIVIFTDSYPMYKFVANYTRKCGIFSVNYVPPAIFSFRATRVRHEIDCVLCVFPDQLEFYKEGPCAAFYVGNPSVNLLSSRRHKGSVGEQQVVAVLPGSRISELKYMLPVYMALAKEMPRLHFRVSVMSSLSEHLYASAEGLANVELIVDDPYTLLEEADVALITSGTASLDAAIIGIPQLVCYKLHPINSWMFRKIYLRRAKIKYISLVNLILERQVVQECVQFLCAVRYLKPALEELLHDKALRARMKSDYAALRKKFGDIDSGTLEVAAQCIMTTYEKHQRYSS